MRATDDLCPAHRYDDPEGERFICVREPHITGAWGFVCWGCLTDMLNAKARREEFELEGDEA